MPQRLKMELGIAELTAAALVVLCLFLVPKVTFNYNFNSLGNSDLESFRLDFEVNELLGYSQTPMVVLTDSLAEERSAAAQLRDQIRELESQLKIAAV